MKTLDIKFEIENYFSKNNFRTVDLSELTLPEIHEHAKKLDSELSSYKREVKFEGETKDIRAEIISFINFSLGIK